MKLDKSFNYIGRQVITEGEKIVCIIDTYYSEELGEVAINVVGLRDLKRENYKVPMLNKRRNVQIPNPGDVHIFFPKTCGD